MFNKGLSEKERGKIIQGIEKTIFFKAIGHATAASKSLQSCQLCATPEMAAHQAPRPWDSPGKNTGVGCHFLLQCMKVKSESEVAELWTNQR